MATPSALRKTAQDGATSGAATVLLVDDEPDLRAVVAYVLAEEGYHVLVADGAEGALALLRSPASIDLLFTDIAMPGTDGLALADAAKSLRPDLRVLYTSAYGADAASHATVRYGPVLEKPWRPAQLQAMLRELLPVLPRR
jgi:CheY-like chemotaxis protein